MSAKFLALALLVQLYVAGQAANIEAIKHSNSNDSGRNDDASKDARSEVLTLEKFTWTYTTTEGRTTLTACTKEDFEVDDQTVQEVTLLTAINDGPQQDCEGIFSGTAKNCATFTGAENCAVEAPFGNVKYKLVVFVMAQSFVEVYKIGTGSFTMTVEAATLRCGSTSFIRATGVFDAQIGLCEAPGVANVCYKIGDMFVQPFCFPAEESVEPGLILCLGGNNHVSSAADGVLSIDQLEYTPVPSAIFSLTHMNSNTADFEAIVLNEQGPLQSCAVTPVADSSGTCTLVDFTGGHAEYEVCTILPVAGGFQTAISSITDLDVRAEADETSVQFRFTNANPDMKYVAKIEAGLLPLNPPTVIIDCTGVAQDHICYGFLEGSFPDTFLTIEYLAADGVTTSNKIAIPTPVLTSL